MKVREAIAYLDKCSGDAELLIMDPMMDDVGIESIIRFTSENQVCLVPEGSGLADEDEEDDDDLEDEQDRIESRHDSYNPPPRRTALEQQHPSCALPLGDVCVMEPPPKVPVDVIRVRGRSKSV